MRRFGIFVVGVVVLGIVAFNVAIWLIAAAILSRESSPLGVAATAILLIVALFVAVAAARTLVPLAITLRDLARSARAIEVADYSGRVVERGPRQLRALTRAFNHMSARLEASDEHRRSMLAEIMHELRTPLSVIRGQAEGIIDGVYPADPSHAATILEATRALERLVGDLGTLALSDAGSLRLEYEEVDLAVLLNEVVGSYRPAADEKGVRLDAVAGPELPAIEADPVRLRSVVANLVANAVRHTPAGGVVTVGAAATADAVTVSVADTGSGIAAELRPRVFDRFVKGPGSDGSGLGLAIARDIVEAHRGTIELGGEAGTGTRMSFSLPLGRP
jgi:signal transduction histidine kinase